MGPMLNYLKPTHDQEPIHFSFSLGGNASVKLETLLYSHLLLHANDNTISTLISPTLNGRNMQTHFCNPKRHRIKQAPFFLLFPLLAENPHLVPTLYFKILQPLWEELDAWSLYVSCHQLIEDLDDSKNLGKKLNLLNLWNSPLN
jgi:hypothetical protein